jgi:hypothetical protein
MTYLTELLEQLPYSTKNTPNVRSILKKLMATMGIQMFLKKDYKDAEKLKAYVIEAMKPSKYAEATQVLFRVGESLGVKQERLDALEAIRDNFRENRLKDYKENAKFIPDNFENVKTSLKKFFDDRDEMKRRLAKFVYAYGGIRQGDIRQTKIHTKRTYPKDKSFNYFMIHNKTWLIYNHKNAHRSKQERELEIPELLLDEMEDSENGVFYLTNTETPANASKITRVFKSMANITMKDLRHMEAEHFKDEPVQKQKEVADKNGHSLSTMRLLYSNFGINGDISETMVEDAKQHYERILKKLEEQQKTTPKELTPAD